MSTVSETLRGWAVHEVVADRRAQAGVGVLATVLPLAVLPFLVGDATKILLAFLLTGTIRKMSLGRR